MNRRQKIYKILGIVFIVWDVLGNLATLNELRKHFSMSGYDIGYLLGSQFLLIIGVVFLICSYSLKKRILKSDLKSAIDEIGKP